MILNLLKAALFEGKLGTQAITTQYGQFLELRERIMNMNE